MHQGQVTIVTANDSELCPVKITELYFQRFGYCWGQEGGDERYLHAELGIIGDNSTNRQRINRSTLLIIGYRLALEMALSVCRLKTKSDDRQIELSIRTI
jgi:hypothetical protein